MLDNQLWGQVGFSACNLPGNTLYNFTTFYQIWDTTVPPGTLLVDGESTVATEGLHTYAMNVQNGTVWQYTVDGNVLGSFDMGSATASSPGAVGMLCEEGTGSPRPSFRRKCPSRPPCPC